MGEDKLSLRQRGAFDNIVTSVFIRRRHAPSQTAPRLDTDDQWASTNPIECGGRPATPGPSSSSQASNRPGSRQYSSELTPATCAGCPATWRTRPTMSGITIKVFAPGCLARQQRRGILALARVRRRKRNRYFQQLEEIIASDSNREFDCAAPHSMHPRENWLIKR